MPVRYLVTSLLDLVSATFVKFVWHRGLGMWIFTESCQIAHFPAKLSIYATTPELDVLQEPIIDGENDAENHQIDRAAFLEHRNLLFRT
jgi:hypothetical protein